MANHDLLTNNDGYYRLFARTQLDRFPPVPAVCKSHSRLEYEPIGKNVGKHVFDAIRWPAENARGGRVRRDCRCLIADTRVIVQKVL